MSRTGATIGALLLLATGCDGTDPARADGDDARAALTEAGRTVDELADDLATRLPAPLDAELISLRTQWWSCTDGRAGDARAVGHLQYAATGREDGPALAAAADALRAAGWDVTPDGEVVRARRDGVDLRLRVGEHAVDVDLRTACVTAPHDLATEFTGRSPRVLP